MTTRTKVWDPVVRVFHWTLVTLFAANAVLTDPEHKIHHYVGYAIAALVLLRLAWGLVGSRYARFASFPPNPRAALEQLADVLTGRRRIHLGHTPLGALMIYNLLLALAVITASGYAMTTVAFWGVKWMEELHEAAVTWAEISVLVHVAAVIWESRRTGVNLPRAMVTGYKEVPEDVMIAE
ncbi:Cytochrome b [Rubellimicrobium mesophilum DSM 19309]|uniref:Cytochrome b n=1 Tax=Rubellimicrobium mesophilum DSM 19309 TaxID=442562 RepID=A0A017HRW3_9RHOB|nr:cytochrome b/b6 domain-containing protein [Rubellimicrobium mesophilum]EYD77247.1 Cytochrome b [Rubellimicrobium mesophilum DSM 19309]